MSPALRPRALLAFSASPGSVILQFSGRCCGCRSRPCGLLCSHLPYLQPMCQCRRRLSRARDRTKPLTQTAGVSGGTLPGLPGVIIEVHGERRGRATPTATRAGRRRGELGDGRPGRPHTWPASDVVKKQPQTQLQRVSEDTLKRRWATDAMACCWRGSSRHKRPTAWLHLRPPVRGLPRIA